MIRSLFVSLLSFLFLMQFSSVAQAYEGFNLSVGSLYYSSKVKNETTNTEVTQKQWLQSVRAGYAFEGGVYFGAVYDTHESGDHSDINMLGASIGFIDEGDYIIFHYIAKSNYQLDASTEAHKGSGFGIDMGSNYLIWKQTFYIGWQLSYRAIHFDKAQWNGTTLNNKYKYSNFYPLIVLGFAL